MQGNDHFKWVKLWTNFTGRQYKVRLVRRSEIKINGLDLVMNER